MSVLAIGISNSDTARRLIKEADAYATDTAQSLVVAYIVTENEFRARQRAYRGLRQCDATYSLEQAESRAEELARRLAADVLHDASEESLCVGHVGVPRQVIPRVAREYECDHIFMAQHHQPWYRLLSRNLVDDVSQTFSGHITTRSEKAR
jgi:nucleotide-binding universal stress UspA family protein